MGTPFNLKTQQPWLTFKLGLACGYLLLNNRAHWFPVRVNVSSVKKENLVTKTVWCMKNSELGKKNYRHITEQTLYKAQVNLKHCPSTILHINALVGELS